jgi:PAS domain-containing protein
LLSSKGKIRLVLVIAVSLSLITALVSLLYMNSMISRIRQITLRDARLVDLGRDISIKVLDARREEKNFIIYLDSTYIDQTLSIVDMIESNVVVAKEIAPDQITRLDSISTLISAYKSDITILRKTFEEDPRALSSLQRQLVDYEERLKKTVTRNELQADSLPNLLSDLNILAVAATAKLSTEKARLLGDLRETTTSILALAGRIVTQAQNDLAQHGEEGVRYGFKAQRNTITIFIITILLLAYLVIYFPRLVLLPFQRITKTLRAISKGETAFRIDELEKSGEFAELYSSFHDAIYDLKLHNDLKTEKIVDLQRQFQGTLDEIKEACIIISGEMELKYINKAGMNLFGLENSVFGKNIEDVPLLWKTLQAPIEASENERRIEANIRVKRTDLRKRSVTILSFISRSSASPSRLIIIK